MLVVKYQHYFEKSTKNNIRQHSPFVNSSFTALLVKYNSLFSFYDYPLEIKSVSVLLKCFLVILANAFADIFNKST